MAVHHAYVVSLELGRTIEHVREQGTTRKMLQHLRERRSHAGALSRGQDDDAQTQNGSSMNDSRG
jgi:hypothetical protein